jgi:hypothetical protein
MFNCAGSSACSARNIRGGSANRAQSKKLTACQTIEVLNGVTPNVQALQSQRSLRLG